MGRESLVNAQNYKISMFGKTHTKIFEPSVRPGMSLSGVFLTLRV